MSKYIHAHVQAQEEKFDTCLDCSELIYNPICPECIYKAFQQWINRYPRYGSLVVPFLNRYLASHKKLEGNAQICVVCGKENTYICPYCFCKLIYDLLKEVGAPKSVLKEYILFFHFDLGDFEKQRWGHYYEGEKHGVF